MKPSLGEFLTDVIWTMLLSRHGLYTLESSSLRFLNGKGARNCAPKERGGEGGDMRKRLDAAGKKDGGGMREKSLGVKSTSAILQKRGNIRLILRHTFTFLSSSCKDVLLDICFTTSSHYLFAHNSKDINRGKPESLPVSFFVHLHDTEERESDILSSSPFMRYPPLSPTQFASSISRWGEREARQPNAHTNPHTHSAGEVVALKKEEKWGGDALHLTSPTFPPFLL